MIVLEAEMIETVNESANLPRIGDEAVASLDLAVDRAVSVHPSETGGVSARPTTCLSDKKGGLSQAAKQMVWQRLLPGRLSREGIVAWLQHN